MMVIVDITHADGSVDSRVYDADQLTLGRDPAADVAIPRATELEAAHLLIAPRETGCWISTARGVEVSPLIGGTVLENGIVPYETDIDVGSISIRVKRIVSRGDTSRLRTVAVGAVGVLAIGLTWSWLTRGREALPTTSAAAPALFSDERAACPEPNRAAELAADALHDSGAKQARYPFDPREGIAAVELLRTAEGCFETAGDSRSAEAARGTRERLRRRIDGDYKVARVLLRRAADARDYARLATDARHLLAYVSHRSGAYRDWLILLQRHAESRLENQEPRDQNL